MIIPNESGGGISKAPLSEILSAASQIEGLDIRLALGRISGKQDVLETSIEQMAYLIEGRIEKMRNCLLSGALYDFYLEAHGIKAALAGIGAMRHSALALELETASKAGDKSFCEGKFEMFAVLMTSLAFELQSVLPAEDAIEKREGDGKRLFSAFRGAANYLDSFEADDALGCISRLDTFSFDEETEALIRQIKGKIKNFKYDEALQIIKSVLG